MAVIYRCDGRSRGVCDYESDAKWRGRCPQCGGYYSIVTRGKVEEKSKTSLAHLTETVKKVYIPTGLEEFDSVIGGGIVPDAPYILSGTRGLGKSTLLTTVASLFATEKRPVLYTSGEQSKNDVASIAQRIGAVSEHVEVLGNVEDLDEIFERAEEIKAKLVIIDSLQTTTSSDSNARAGSAHQLRIIADRIVAWCKDEKVAVIAIGHVGRDGELAGPTTIGHLFDCELELDPVVTLDEDGEEIPEEKKIRLSCPNKNRHGKTGIESFFKMTEKGIVSIEKKSKKSKLIV